MEKIEMKDGVALSARQYEIIQRILAGRTPKSIAFELELSIYTVREHLSAIYGKFAVGGRDELMAHFIPKLALSVAEPTPTAGFH